MIAAYCHAVNLPAHLALEDKTSLSPFCGHYEVRQTAEHPQDALWNDDNCSHQDRLTSTFIFVLLKNSCSCYWWWLWKRILRYTCESERPKTCWELHTCSLTEWLNNYIWWQNSDNLWESSTEINLNLQSVTVGRPLFLKCLGENILMCYTLYLPLIQKQLNRDVKIS